MSSSRDINLKATQKKALSDALIDAFPTQGDLAAMLMFQLGKQLNVISTRDNLRLIVLDLIQAADSQDWTTQLIRAAREANPGNETLLSFAQSVGLGPGAPTLPHSQVGTVSSVQVGDSPAYLYVPGEGEMVVGDLRPPGGSSSTAPGHKSNLATWLMYGGVVGALVAIIAFVAWPRGNAPVSPNTTPLASVSPAPGATSPSSGAVATDAAATAPGVSVTGTSMVVFDFVEQAGSATWYWDSTEPVPQSKRTLTPESYGCDTPFVPMVPTGDYRRIDLNPTDYETDDENNIHVLSEGDIAPNHQPDRKVTGPYLFILPIQETYKIHNRMIAGLFKKHHVEAGDHFKSQLSFRDRAESQEPLGSVEVRLHYYTLIDGTDTRETQLTQPLERRCVRYNDTTNGPVDFNIGSSEFSKFVGRDVQFELMVLTDNSADGDYLIWLWPRIERQLDR
jgi:hypothetical protein